MRSANVVRVKSLVLILLVNGLILSSLTSCTTVRRQSSGKKGIANVTGKRIGKQIVVNYDLLGNRSCEIILQVSSGPGPPYITPDLVSGDVGKGVRPGRYKEIVWEIERERTFIDENQAVFYVHARRPLIRNWVVGALVLGAAAVAATEFQEPGTGTIVIDIPDPEK